jgi:WD40 repeat protein
VTAAQLNHRGDVLVTGGRDDTVRLWRVDGDRPRQLTTLDVAHQPMSLTVSPDDRTLLVGGGPTQVWDITTAARPTHAANLPESDFNTAVAFEPAGKTVVLTVQNRTKAYDLTNPYRPTVTNDLAPSAATTVAFHPHGDVLATTKDGLLELWNARSAVKLAPSNNANNPVVKFSPDGHTMAVFLQQTGETQLWDVTTPRKPTVLTTFRPRVPIGQNTWGPPPPVYSANGRVLAIVDSERTARLWDIGHPHRPAHITDFSFAHPIKALTMTPDGRRLFVATDENVVQQRYLDTEDVAKRICTIAYPRISQAEWRKHFHNLPYQPPCQ